MLDVSEAPLAGRHVLSRPGTRPAAIPSWTVAGAVVTAAVLAVLVTAAYLLRPRPTPRS